jgi:hypothetical protein
MRRHWPHRRASRATGVEEGMNENQVDGATRGGKNVARHASADTHRDAYAHSPHGTDTDTGTGAWTWDPPVDRGVSLAAIIHGEIR